MATQPILVAGNYNGVHNGGPYPVPAGTSEISIDAHVTSAPPGANFKVSVDTSHDGGATWQERCNFGCPGGSGIPKGGTVPINYSANTEMGIDLDPSQTYLARFHESSSVTVAASANITLS